MMIKLNYFKTFALLCVFGLLTISCDEDASSEVSGGVKTLVLGLESTGDTPVDVLVHAEELTSEISTIDNGVVQDAWSTFLQVGNTVLSTGYSTDNQLVGYRVVDGELTDIGRLFTDKGLYAFGAADENTLLTIGLDRAGFSARKLYTVDVEGMSITSTDELVWDDRSAEGLMSWPTDIAVRGDKMFISYYLMDTAGYFSTPNSNQARVAVYSYPGLVFEKIMTDDRTSDVGRYTSINVLEEDEKGDLYTFSSSSIASGFYPTPTNPSGFLRINSGATEFDSEYFFDFQTLSGGYKINDMAYIGNGKAIVRMLLEDPTLDQDNDQSPDFLWGAYAPKSPISICGHAIVDLYAETVTPISGIPTSAASWSFAHLVKDGDVYLNVSNAEIASIYKVDVANATAEEVSKLEANYAKGIFEVE